MKEENKLIGQGKEKDTLNKLFVEMKFIIIFS
jgi:hypothetical protein